MNLDMRSYLEVRAHFFCLIPSITNLATPMEHLWSPWRSSYIQSFSKKPAVESCFLCDAVGAAPEHDAENLVVHRTERCFVIMNRYPYNAGHLMVVPNIHCGDFGTLPADVAAEMMSVMQLSHTALTEMFHPHGFNMGANLGRVAGAGVPDHLHMHLLPRWNGDTNFMPLISETKVVSESLVDTARELRSVFSTISG
jgi:ATP adenylyltransferase